MTHKGRLIRVQCSTLSEVGTNSGLGTESFAGILVRELVAKLPGLNRWTCAQGVMTCADVYLSPASFCGRCGRYGHRQSQSEADQQFQAGRDALKAGKNKEALDTFKKLNKLQNNSCAQCYISMAIAYLRMGQSENAVASCDKAISVASDDPTRATAHSMKGTVLLSLDQNDGKKLKDAEAEYRTATELDKHDPVFRLNLATALLRQSKDEEAKEELKKCLALHPTQAVADQATALMANPRLSRAVLLRSTSTSQPFRARKFLSSNLVARSWSSISGRHGVRPAGELVPELKDLTRKYANAKVVLISVSADKDEKAGRDFVAKKRMDWPQNLTRTTV